MDPETIFLKKKQVKKWHVLPGTKKIELSSNIFYRPAWGWESRDVLHGYNDEMSVAH